MLLWKLLPFVLPLDVHTHISLQNKKASVSFPLGNSLLPASTDVLLKCHSGWKVDRRWGWSHSKRKTWQVSHKGWNEIKEEGLLWSAIKSSPSHHPNSRKQIITMQSKKLLTFQISFILIAWQRPSNLFTQAQYQMAWTLSVVWRLPYIKVITVCLKTISSLNLEHWQGH